MKPEIKKLPLAILLSVFVFLSYNYVIDRYSDHLTQETIEVPKQKMVVTNNIKKELNGIIISPLNKLLVSIYDHTGNLGWAIIILTLLLKTILTPLQYIALKSSKKIKEIQPLLKNIKQKFKSDLKRQRDETARVFKEKKVNPLHGIIPSLLSIPIFWALFQIFKESSSTIGASFVSWLVDLSLPDPLYILPILAGVLYLLSMLFGGSSPGNKISNKLKFFMVGVFTIFMCKMPAAILLYTITSTGFSIVEKYLINRIIV